MGERRGQHLEPAHERALGGRGAGEDDGQSASVGQFAVEDVVGVRLVFGRA